MVNPNLAIYRVGLEIHIDVIMPRPTGDRFIALHPGFFTLTRDTPIRLDLQHIIRYQEQVADARENLFTLMALWYCTSAEPPTNPSPYRHAPGDSPPRERPARREP